MSKFKRVNYLPKKSFQVKLLFKIYLSIFVIIVLLSGTLFFINKSSIDSAKKNVQSYISKITIYNDNPSELSGLKAIVETKRMSDDIKKSLTQIETNMAKAFSAAIVIALIMVLTIFLVLSHRIAGPIYRFEQTLLAMRDGDLSIRIKLRDGDELKEIAEIFNNMATSLNEKMNQLQEIILELNKELEDNKSLSSADREKLQIKITTLQNIVKQFKVVYS